GHHAALACRANVLLRAGRADEALAGYDAILAREPRSPAVLCNRGNALRLLARHEEALESYDRALALDPSLATAAEARRQLMADRAR
ncbi:MULTISPECIES: tetratricopeptide repeat protein, partial [unclassified Burkholderia]